MPLRACMESHTEFERDVTLYWYREHFEDRSLTDHYLQRIAYEIANMNTKYRKRPQMEDFHVQFDRAIQEPDKQTLSKRAQAKWFALTGYKGK